MEATQGFALCNFVHNTHADDSVKLYAVHAYIFLHFSITLVATIFCKHRNTIGKWIKKWLTTGSVSRQQSAREDQYSQEQRLWIEDLVNATPHLYLHEIV